MIFRGDNSHLLLPGFNGSPATFASAFELDPSTSTIMVVLMQQAQGGYELDWNAAYMLPVAVVRAAQLNGLWDLSWDDHAACWLPSSIDRHSQQRVAKLEAVTNALRQWWKKDRRGALASAQKAARVRLQGRFEGQLVLHDGQVMEVRGLERASRDTITVLPYELIDGSPSPSRSLWQLRHNSELKSVPRHGLRSVDWTLPSRFTADIMVHM